MGTEGLWNYVCRHGLCSTSYSGGSNSLMTPDHLLIEMNALVHSAIEETKFMSKKVIKKFIESVKRLMRQFPPHKTLAFVFDGVAPVSKIPTQKERRATMTTSHIVPLSADTVAHHRYNYDYQQTEVPLVREEVISGSEFLLACEEALRALVTTDAILDLLGKKNSNELTTIISGCNEAGEGEIKIASIIQELWLKQKQAGTYTGDDVIVIIGNDSDLVLISIACTPYREFYLVHPVDLTITTIAKLFDHWMKGAPKEHAFSKHLHSYRIDFVFLMLLSGGDWYKGIGRLSTLLWTRYRDLRFNQGFHKRPLIRGEDFYVDVEFLRAIMDDKTLKPMLLSRPKSKSKRFVHSASSSMSEKASNDGVELLKGAMWALKSIVHGRCFDYSFCVFPTDPTVGALKAAANLTNIASRIRPVSREPLPPLTPLEHCLAVMGKRGRFSAEILRALTTLGADKGKKLTQSCSISYLLPQIRLLMANVDKNKLTSAELYLLETHHRRLFDQEDDEKNVATFMSYTCKTL